MAMDTEPLIRVTVCVKRRPGMTEDEFTDYWVRHPNTHSIELLHYFFWTSAYFIAGQHAWHVLVFLYAMQQISNIEQDLSQQTGFSAAESLDMFR
jgi:hypothetical protein